MSAPSSSGSLERGRACLRCRRRKVRCDGGQPACGQCMRANKIDECEYTFGAGLTATQLLEQEVVRLESCIAELQNRSFVITLRNPYEQGESGSVPTQTPLSPNQLIVDFSLELPANMTEVVLNSFLEHASQVGFFLNIQRLLNLINSGPASRERAHPRIPSVLLNAIYLLGLDFRRDAHLEPFRLRLLSYTLQQLPSAVSNARSLTMSYVLQAEILLSYYFFDHNRGLEGAYHSNAAIAMVLAWKLHLIRSPQNTITASVALGQANLLPPSDKVEEGERINAFWAVFVLDKCWSVALGVPSGFADDGSTGTQIDTPWPMTNYAALPANFQSMRTVQTFMQNIPARLGSEQSIHAAQAKASLLFERAARLASQWELNNTSIQASLLFLDNCIERFKATLPAMDGIYSARPDIIRNLLMVHTLAHCATIQLHTPAAQASVASSDITLTAAEAAIRALQGVNTDAIEFITPIMPVLWTMVAQVISRRIVRSRGSDRASPSAVPGPAVPGPDQASLLASFDRILVAMQRWSNTSPLMKHQQTVLHQARARV
ncbi:hypothetical protein SCP_0905350 [Sparassis crispa]|uniref:Zn(2)-C6 fungal-type domain-containing protein n=1 Tax=Sparassis crispa TaxID=139825 RepID=A0A401GWR1_9APHY|nr:hypothetical protein SCP_0905350 [Sparassis crispa]GBE86655.1 hypothetical protein SCP_0905350 [Sparassis crispa]